MPDTPKNKLNTFIEYIFYIFIFLLPLQTRYILTEGELNNGLWEYGTYSVYAIDLLLLFIFILSFFYKSKIKLIVSHWSLVIGFWLLSFISVYWAVNQELGFYYWLRITGILIFLFIIAKLNLSFKKISWSLVLAGLLQSLLAIAQFFSQKVIASKWLGIAAQTPSTLGVQVIEGPAERWLRAYGSLPHPNILGGFLVICLLLCLYLILKNKTRSQQIILFICLSFISIGLFFTFSRAAAIGLIISLLFLFLFIYLFQKKYLKQFFKLLIVPLLILITLTSIYPSLVFNRFNQVNRLEKKSFVERAVQHQQSLELISKNWPTGVGPGNYTQAVHDEINNKLKSFEYQPVHNIYLLILTEYGAFGLIIILLLIINSFKNIKPKNFDSLFLGTILIAIMSIGFFDHYFFTLNFGLLLFWLPLGLLKRSV